MEGAGSRFLQKTKDVVRHVCRGPAGGVDGYVSARVLVFASCIKRPNLCLVFLKERPAAFERASANRFLEIAAQMNGESVGENGIGASVLSEGPSARGDDTGLFLHEIGDDSSLPFP